MVAQVIAAPVIAVGKAVAVVAKTTMTMAMKAGTAVGKATMSAAKATGSAFKAGFSKSVATAGKMGKGISSGMKPGPLTSRFSSLANARAGAARAASQGAGPRATSLGRSPVSQSVQRGMNRWNARERMKMPRQSHAVDERERAVNERLSQLQNQRERKSGMSALEKMARFARDRAVGMMEFGRNVSQPGHMAQMAAQQRETEQGRSIER